MVFIAHSVWAGLLLLAPGNRWALLKERAGPLACSGPEFLSSPRCRVLWWFCRVLLSLEAMPGDRQGKVIACGPGESSRTPTVPPGGHLRAAGRPPAARSTRSSAQPRFFHSGSCPRDSATPCNLFRDEGTDSRGRSAEGNARLQVSTWEDLPGRCAPPRLRTTRPCATGGLVFGPRPIP